MAEWACKPNSVRPRRGAGDHLSRPTVARRLMHPTRSLQPRCGRRDGPPLAAYLGLLAVGFTMPQPSPAARCALTAPFHPYRPSAAGHLERDGPAVWLRRCLFCGTFPRLAPGWRYQPPCPVQFGLSSCPAKRNTRSPQPTPPINIITPRESSRNISRVGVARRRRATPTTPVGGFHLASRGSTHPTSERAGMVRRPQTVDRLSGPPHSILLEFGGQHAVDP